MTEIQWTNVVWNPTVGCSRVSDGCAHCYAERFAHRGLTEAHRGLTVAGPKGPRWTGEVRLVPERLSDPLRWRKPRRIFVNSMSDLFHDEVPFEFVDRVFAVMALTPHHTYQVLTKRPGRMLEYLADLEERSSAIEETPEAREASYDVDGFDDGKSAAECERTARNELGLERIANMFDGRPLPNVWLGVSAENQATADERIPLLLQCPAAVRFVSAEPLLGPIEFWMIRDGSWYDREGANLYNALRGTAYWSNGDHGIGGGPRLNWVIVGGESGPGARPCDVSWIRSIVEQCRNAGVACFVKQLGAAPVQSPAHALRHLRGADAARSVGTYPGAEREMLTPLPMQLRDRKGGDPSEWPTDLRIREFPEVRR